MKLLNKGIYTLLLLLIISTPFACTEDNEDYSIIAGLDFNVATLNANGNKIGVIPTTVPGDGRIVFTVDFGDPANTDNSDVFRTSGPMVSYSYPLESKTYTISVTAAMAGNEDVSITKDHTVVYAVQPPPSSGSPLEGTWKLAPEAGALGVGPGKDNVSWWSNSTADVTTRACLFDDKYVFNADGTFENVLGTESWIEVWQGIAADGCGAPVFPHDGTASATYEYNEAAGTIKLTGKGAYLGLPKAYNLGELTTPGDAPDEITYEAALSSDGNTLEIDIKVNDGNNAHWSFKFVKASSPIVGTWKLAPEAGALGVGPGKDNVSWWSNSTADVTTRACLFDDKYVFNADGTFENVLGTESWIEVWQGIAADGCGAPVFPHDGTASATYEYNEAAGSIKLTGKGAYLGLPKAYNLGELTTPGDAPDEITYEAALSSDGNTLEIDIKVNDGNNAHWSFKFVKE